MTEPRPKLAVWKFTSCDGCQLTLLDCEDELLTLAEEIEIAYFMEATSARVEGPYDLSIVEGSITTPDELERIQQVRASSDKVIAIGACATAGGIQALRNFGSVEGFQSIVYASPRTIATLDTSTAISDHIAVDLELHGCPIDRDQLLETISALLNARRPRLPAYSVCVECKRRGTPCITVSQGTPCLGPVTRAGCGALCPAYNRGCYGCFGPMETPNTKPLAELLKALGESDESITRVFRTFYAAAPAFSEESTAHE